MWNYIFYKAYLQFKPKTELTGIEQDIYDMIQRDSLNWFPIRRYIFQPKYVQKASSIAEQSIGPN